ncbi:MAG TPA: inositol-3-phosphate synthase [Candidatus Deferrimicrobium sp.]|nr:inositol-3-phosphate synthase [Candidatus Deferrimicrobium sp.]
MNKKLLFCIAGLGGAVGSTVCVGLSIGDSDVTVRLGMATESKIIKDLGLDFLSLDSVLIDGWDIKTDNLYSLAKNHMICPNELCEKVKEKLEKLVPRKFYNKAGQTIEGWIKCEANYIKEKCLKNNIDQAIIVNLCPTEPDSLQCDDKEVNWEDLSSIKLNLSGVTISRLYFRLAVEAGAHFINYTPNIAETENLKSLAEERGILYCGRDGKTGQTFLKTVIAPALRDKNLKIDGWFSINILGNNDGENLSNEDCKLTKRKSKSECLNSILGYTPGGKDSEYGHQVHIHYYPPRRDAKEAWDNIDFSGFLGARMQMKIDWLGQDSILAAPSVIDLARIVNLAARNGNKGLLSDVSYFFKSPLTQKGKPVQHATPAQFSQLMTYLNTNLTRHSLKFGCEN